MGLEQKHPVGYSRIVTNLELIQKQTWDRLIRFIADDGLEYCGQPEDPDLDRESFPGALISPSSD